MRPKKETLERAGKAGAIDRMNGLLSAAYLLMSEAYCLYDEANDLMKAYGLNLGGLKKNMNATYRDFDQYFQDFRRLVPESQKGNYFGDLDAFDRKFRGWAGLADGENEKQEDEA